MTLELQILSALRDVQPHLMPETTLLAQMRLAEVTEVTASRLRGVLGKLEGQREVIGVPNADTGTKWGLSDAGEARLTRAGL